MSAPEVFDGFPYLHVDFGDGVAHVIPLPSGGTRHALQRLAFDQVLVWRRPFALVFGPDDALLFDANGGSVRTTTPPGASFFSAGRPSGAASAIDDPDLAERLDRAAAYSAAAGQRRAG